MQEQSLTGEVQQPRNSRYQNLLDRGYVPAEIGRSRNNPATLYYKTKGNGPKKVVFIMGFCTRGESWRPQTDYFGSLEDYQVVEFDNRGVGLSSHESFLTGGRYTTKMFAEDTIDLIDFLGWEKVHIVGISMGGMIAQELSLLIPDRILSLCLVSTHAGGIKSIVPFTGLSIMLKNMFITKDPLERARNTMNLLFGPAVHQNPELYQELYDGIVERGKKYGFVNFSVFMKHLSAVSTHYFSSENFQTLRNSSFPKLCITGTIDHLIRPSNSIYIAEQIHAQLEIFEDIGHGITMEVPERFNERIKRFFETSMPKSSL